MVAEEVVIIMEAVAWPVTMEVVAPVDQAILKTEHTALCRLNSCESAKLLPALSEAQQSEQQFQLHQIQSLTFCYIVRLDTCEG